MDRDQPAAGQPSGWKGAALGLSRVILSLGVILTLGALAACASSSQPVPSAKSSLVPTPEWQYTTDTTVEGQPGVITWEGYNTEFLREAQNLELPAAYVWPDTAPLPKYAPEDGGLCNFEAGCGTGDADLYWFSCWQKTWLESVGVDSATEQKALSQLLKFTDTPLYQLYSDAPLTALWDELLSAAQRGEWQTIAANLVGSGVVLIAAPAR